MLAKLQEKGINSYDSALQELKDTNEELFFYTPKYRVTVTGIYQRYLEMYHTACAADMAPRSDPASGWPSPCCYAASPGIHDFIH
jgi:hypothetical protein